jgi:hypothetical protein
MLRSSADPGNVVDSAGMPRYSYNPHARRAPDTLFETPTADTQIWRYFPLKRFVPLLQTRRLFLSRVGRLEDEFEGATPAISERALMAWEEKYVGPESRAQYRLNRERAREIVAVNCWHMSKHESVPMWTAYVPGSEGVAVKSTVGRLGASFDQHPDDGCSSHEDIDISKVRYIDYETDHFPLSQTLNHFIHKRMEYEAERELRVLGMITDAAVTAATAGGTEFEVTDAGLFLPVNVETLIHTIYIAPRAARAVQQTVRDLLKSLDLESIPVLPSRLTEKPRY